MYLNTYRMFVSANLLLIYSLVLIGVLLLIIVVPAKCWVITILTPDSLVCSHIWSTFNIQLYVIFKLFLSCTSTEMACGTSPFRHFLHHAFNYIDLTISMKSVIIWFTPLLRPWSFVIWSTRVNIWILTLLMVSTWLLTIIFIVSWFYGHYWMLSD